jgi:anti-sigma-K factor RskA
MKRDDLDIRIAAAVRSEEAEIPAGIRRRAIQRIGERQSLRRRMRLWRPLPWATAAAAAAVLAVLLMSPERPALRPGGAIPPMRTEFSIPGKNLTIVWVTSDNLQMGSYLE